MLSNTDASALVLQNHEGWWKTRSFLDTLSETAQQERQRYWQVRRGFGSLRTQAGLVVRPLESPSLLGEQCGIAGAAMPGTGCSSAGVGGLDSQGGSAPLRSPAFSLLDTEWWISSGESWNVHMVGEYELNFSCPSLFLSFSGKPYYKDCQVSQSSIFCQ